MDSYSSKATKATMMIKASFRPGDAVLVGILASDFFGSIAATIIHLTMVFWVLDQGANDIVFTLLVLAIFIPLNVGVLLSGIAVNRIGARRLLVFSKSVAVLGAFVCYLLLAANAMTLLSLALIAAITYCAMGPSVSADVSRVPSLVRLAQRNLASYHAANSIVLVLGSIIGLLLAGYFADQASPDTATGLGVFLVIISTLITWLSFPKDNLKAIKESTKTVSWVALTKNVYKWLDPKQISLFVIVAAVVIIAIAEIAAEVIAPLALRTAGLPSSYLTYAYSISVIASVSAAVLSQTWQKKMALQPLLVIFLVVFLGATSILFFYQVWPLIVALVAITGASATATGILTVTSLQNQMPLSLQAQAISLWQGLVLMSSSAAIFVSSFLGLYAIVLLAVVALLLGVLPKMKRLK